MEPALDVMKDRLDRREFVCLTLMTSALLMSSGPSPYPPFGRRYGKGCGLDIGSRSYLTAPKGAMRDAGKRRDN